MRVKSLLVAFVCLAIFASTGCKSGGYSWPKFGKKDSASNEQLANSSPQLPSEAAGQYQNQYQPYANATANQYGQSTSGQYGQSTAGQYGQTSQSNTYGSYGATTGSNAQPVNYESQQTASTSWGTSTSSGTPSSSYGNGSSNGATGSSYGAGASSSGGSYAPANTYAGSMNPQTTPYSSTYTGDTGAATTQSPYGATTDAAAYTADARNDRYSAAGGGYSSGSRYDAAGGASADTGSGYPSTGSQYPTTSSGTDGAYTPGGSSYTPGANSYTPGANGYNPPSGSSATGTNPTSQYRPGGTTNYTASSTLPGGQTVQPVSYSQTEATSAAPASTGGRYDNILNNTTTP